MTSHGITAPTLILQVDTSCTFTYTLKVLVYLRHPLYSIVTTIPETHIKDMLQQDEHLVARQVYQSMPKAATAMPIMSHKLHNEYPVVAFLDIKSAYDSVDRSIIWRALANKVQPVLLNLLKNMFDEVLVTVIIHNYESRTIRPRRGVLQGSILSAILYAVFIDDLPRRIQHAPTLTNALAVSTVSTMHMSEAALQDHDRISLRRTYIRATIHC